MGFNIQCDNKGCHKLNEPLLHVETNEVVCSECDQPINSVTAFAKTTLRTIGQIYRGEPKQKKAFAIKCQSCQKVNTPKVETGKQLVCPHCGEPSTVAGPMKQVILNSLGKG